MKEFDGPIKDDLTDLREKVGRKVEEKEFESRMKEQKKTLQKNIDSEVACVMESMVKIDGKMKKKDALVSGEFKKLSNKITLMNQRLVETQAANERQTQQTFQNLKSQIGAIAS